MIFDAETIATPPHSTDADFAIIGAGAAGLFLAKSLMDAGRSVLLLDAGAETVVSAAEFGGATSVGKQHNGVAIGRAFGVGGTTVLWGGQLAEFEPHDLTRPGRAWPLQFAKLSRGYAEAYRRLGLPPAPRTDEAQEALGVARTLDATIEQFFTCWLPQPNFAKLFKANLASPSLRLVTGATAYDFEMTPTGAVTAILASTASGKRVRFPCRVAIVAAGTIGSVQLFLGASRHGQKPWNGNPWVGAAFHDHLGARVGTVALLDEKGFRHNFENATNLLGHKLQPKLRRTATAALEHNTNVCGFFSFDSSLGTQLGNLKQFLRSLRSGVSGADVLSAISSAAQLSGVMLPIALRYLRDRRVFALFDSGIGFNIQAEQLPTASSIRLAANAPGRDGLYSAALDWNIDGGELASIRSFVLQTGTYLERAGLARLTPDSGFMNDDTAALAMLSDTYHQAGGLRMAHTARDGVTDSAGKVFGTTNLYVAGAATMPSSGYANCTLTALALCASLAVHLAEDRVITS